MNKKTVSIVGFGRFGQVLYKLLKDDFAVTLYQRHDIDKALIDNNTVIAKSVSDVYKSDVIFFAVPISSFQSVVTSHQKYFMPQHLLIDVLSVKVHPQKVFQNLLKKSKTRFLLTHPMFGPDSSKNGFENLPIILDQSTATDEEYGLWKKHFASKKLRVVEMSAREHDKLAAECQGLTHFVGRLIDKVGMEPTPIDSSGAKKLLEVKELTCNDTWQLFKDLQSYNPYTLNMRRKLGKSMDSLYNALLPDHVAERVLTIGIQGGVGSFNEKAVSTYITRHEIKNYKIKYLYTTEKVLAALEKGEVDYGQFAIHNSVGGIVKESIRAIANHKFAIVEEYGIPIAHALMIRNDANWDDIDTVMTHDQVLAQCKSTLARKYPQLKQVVGKGDLIDHANVAKHLSEGKLDKNIATMGSDILAKIYNLQIVENNLQDSKNNLTSFLLVKRI